MKTRGMVGLIFVFVIIVGTVVGSCTSGVGKIVADAGQMLLDAGNSMVDANVVDAQVGACQTCSLTADTDANRFRSGTVTMYSGTGIRQFNPTSSSLEVVDGITEIASGPMVVTDLSVEAYLPFMDTATSMLIAKLDGASADLVPTQFSQNSKIYLLIMDACPTAFVTPNGYLGDPPLSIPLERGTLVTVMGPGYNSGFTQTVGGLPARNINGARIFVPAGKRLCAVWRKTMSEGSNTNPGRQAHEMTLFWSGFQPN